MAPPLPGDQEEQVREIVRQEIAASITPLEEAANPPVCTPERARGIAREEIASALGYILEVADDDDIKKAIAKALPKFGGTTSEPGE